MRARWGQLTHDLRVYQAELEMQAHELRQSNERLEVSLAHFRRLFELLPEPAMVVSRDGSIVERNERAEALLRVPLSPSGHLRRIGVSEQDRSQLETGLYRASQYGRDQLADLRVTGATGESLPVDVHYQRLDGWGRSDGDHFLVLVVDQTEEYRRQEQARTEILGQLTGGVAHDFNNLLTVILGFAQQLSFELEDADHLGMVSAVEDAAHRAAALTHRLLDFARRQPVAIEQVRVDEVVARTVELLERTLGELWTLEADLAGGPAEAMVDEAQLENALMNLCLNARDAMHDGGRIRIVLEPVEAGFVSGKGHTVDAPSLVLSVADEGVGIDPELLNTIFEPFFTTKMPGEGTGLGLAIVQEFVRQSGGYVEVDSRLGEGTRFDVYLPQQRGEVATSLPAPPRPRSEVHGETILVVEDDPLVGPFTCRLLERFGYRVEGVDTAGAALDLLAERSYDLLLTDVVLPNMSGAELAAEAASLRPQMPVVFVSGYTEKILVEHDRVPAGANLLKKPYTRDELAAAVASAMAIEGRQE